MIYTCYEMIRDCRAGLAEGWSFFVEQYVPVLNGLAAHYFPDRAGLAEDVLRKLRQPGASLFQTLEPAPERLFVAELRQYLARAGDAGAAREAPQVTIDLEALGAALDGYTLVEKVVVWFETMRIGDADAGRMLRMSPETVQNIRARAAESIRGKVDAWSATVLADNGAVLGKEATGLSTKDCPPPKVFFDVIDGRATWRGREEMEQHVKGCFFCIDHYSRLLEASDFMRRAKPLGETEAAEYRRKLGIELKKKPFWKR